VPDEGAGNWNIAAVIEIRGSQFSPVSLQTTGLFPTASQVSVNASGFTDVLSDSDTDVQTALETIDKHLLTDHADVDSTGIEEGKFWGIGAGDVETVLYDSEEFSQAMDFVTAEVTANRNLALTDLFKTVTVNSAAERTLTIPQNTLAKGEWINIYCKGAGGVVIAVADPAEMTINAEKNIYEGRWAQVVSLDDTTDAEVFHVIGGEL